MSNSIYLENYVRRFIILFLKYSILSVLKLDRFLWRKIIFLHKQKNTNFYFEFKTNNKIQCFFLFQIVRLHSKQRCGTFFPLFTMVDKFVSVKYWSSQNWLRLWTLWFYWPWWKKVKKCHNVVLNANVLFGTKKTLNFVIRLKLEIKINVFCLCKNMIFLHKNRSSFRNNIINLRT